MKFTYSFVLAVLMQVHTPTTMTDFPTCVQYKNATDYGNAWSKDGTGCTDSSRGKEGCCAKFSYIKIDTSLGYDEGIMTEIDQARCLYDTERETHAANFTDSDGTVYSWYCLLDGENEQLSV